MMAGAYDKLKDKVAYGDALLKMVNLLFDPLELATLKELGLTDEANLLGLTRINSSREAFHWAMSITREAGKKPMSYNGKDPNGRKWGLSKIRRTAFLLARRSLDMRAFMMGVGLAGKQSIAEEESEDEKLGWDEG